MTALKTPSFWYGTSQQARWKRRFLQPLSALYTLGRQGHRLFARPQPLPLPSIVLGGGTIGGSGKTPTALALAQFFQARGQKVHFLSRGYGGKRRSLTRVTEAHTAREVGDEPLLLAERAPTWVAADRLAAAQQAAKAGAQILILDDGFHNPHLQTTISILVYDAQQGFGNGALLPAGPLRAPIAETLARATLVVSLGGPFPLPSPVPVLQARLVLKLPPILKAQRAIAFAGLGFPEKFFRTLQDAGVSLVQTFSFPDHHFYKEKELCFLKNEACRHHACLITTRKDFVRLSEKERVGILSADISLIWQYPEKLDAYFDTL